MIAEAGFPSHSAAGSNRPGAGRPKDPASRNSRFVSSRLAIPVSRVAHRVYFVASLASAGNVHGEGRLGLACKSSQSLSNRRGKGGLTMAIRHYFAAIAILFLAGSACSAEPQPYQNFKVTVYIPVQVVERMFHDPDWMQASWKTISARLHVDKVFIESYRSGVSAGDPAISRVKDFFVSQGVAVAGGMAMLAPGGGGQFRTLDYTDPSDRDLAARMSALTARHFDEFILDDLFFTNTKTDSDIAAKGHRTWDQFRMDMMDEVSRDLILKPARETNPKVRVIIKFPNFYPSFQGMGFDLENQPKIFPEIWTGDETRYAPTTDQQLRPYESYEIFRYFENIAPGRNGGGWVDPIAMEYLDRYAEQLWDTILAKAPAINLFEYADLLRIADPGARSPWQSLPTSFNYFAMMRECCGFPGAPGSANPLLADVVAYSLRQVDRVAGSLGAPVGLSSYRPLDSTGEDFLPEVLGMVGVPVEMYPEWPNSRTVFLTEAADHDPAIVSGIEQHLRAGDAVVITSGLLRKLQDKGLDQITDMRVTPNVVAASQYVDGFGFGSGTILGASKPILFPDIHFYTNEDWAVVRGLSNGNGVPLLLMDRYGKGELYVLNVPEEMNDFYSLPPRVLDAIRRFLSPDLPVRLEGPAQVSLFAYDNGTFVIESFLDQPAAVRVIGAFARLENVTTGTSSAGDPAGPGGGLFAAPSRPGAAAPPKEYGYELRIEPHSFLAFRGQP